MDYKKECDCMINACKKASERIMQIYKNGFKINYKSDASPVTDADLASNEIIRNELSVFNDIGWLSEEDADNDERFSKKAIFVIDPLDGTADFVSHDDSFGINIALVVDRHPVVSVVGVPAKKAYAYAIKGHGSYLVVDNKEEKLHVSDRIDNLIMVQSLTHNLDSEKAILRKYTDRIQDVKYMGASTKAIALAKGDVDCSIRFTNMTKEWDVCAPELIVTEAGGIFVDTKLKPFIYNRKDVYNHNGYCMFNKKENEFLLE